MKENHFDCSRVAQHALVYGPNGHDEPNPILPAQPVHSAIQADPSQEPVKPESSCLAPKPQLSRSRTSLRQWKHELRLLQETQPDQSMRQSEPFLQSDATVVRWTLGHPL